MLFTIDCEFVVLICCLLLVWLYLIAYGLCLCGWFVDGLVVWLVCEVCL